MLIDTDPVGMSSEEVARRANTILENIGNNLKKFLDVKVDSAPKKDGVYNNAPAAGVPKRDQFEQDLALIIKGLNELQMAAEDNLKSKLVSPEKHSP